MIKVLSVHYIDLTLAAGSAFVPSKAKKLFDELELFKEIESFLVKVLLLLATTRTVRIDIPMRCYNQWT